jgi:hypothetical protein
MITSKKTGTYPVFIGPLLIHQRQTYENYFHFASELVKYCKPLQALRCIGTDGEEALSNAFGSVFPGAVRLLCSLHKRDNLRMKLRELSVPENSSKDILNSIFGYQLDQTFNPGLIDAEDTPDFISKLESLNSKWDKTFYDWFLSTQADLFCSYMICRVRTKAGLGFPPSSYTTNNNESINKVLKDKTSYKQQEWPEFNLKVFELVNEQQEEFSKALCGYGEYSFIDDYKFLDFSHMQWLQMIAEQRKNKVNKAMNAVMLQTPCAYQYSSR